MRQAADLTGHQLVVHMCMQFHNAASSVARPQRMECHHSLLRERTSSHGLSPFLVLMLFFSSARGRYGFEKTSGPVGKGEDG